MQRKVIESFDCTPIAYEVGGQGDRWLVVANGYGGSFWAWTEIFEYLAPRYRILLWDYRGLHDSGCPDDWADLTIENNCRDLDRLMEAEGIERMVMAGWSVGVQVSLEQYRRRPQCIEALLLINGAHGRVLRRSMDGRLAAHLLPAVLRPVGRAAPLLSRVVLPPLRRLADSPVLLPLLSSLGLVSGRPESVPTALAAVLRLDWQRYIHMMFLADDHDADDLLPRVAVPTLVTAGDRDIITRPRVAREIAARIPGAEYFEIPGGTHYAVMEYPQLVAERMDRFIRERLEPGAG